VLVGLSPQAWLANEPSAGRAAALRASRARTQPPASRPGGWVRPPGMAACGQRICGDSSRRRL